MAKHNDMPELNSAKVFLTNLFTKEHLKHFCQPLLTTGNNLKTRCQISPTLLQNAFRAAQAGCFQAMRHYVFQHRPRPIKALQLTAPGYFCPAMTLLENSDMNGLTVYGFNCNSALLRDELNGFAKTNIKVPL